MRRVLLVVWSCCASWGSRYGSGGVSQPWPDFLGGGLLPRFLAVGFLFAFTFCVVFVDSFFALPRFCSIAVGDLSQLVDLLVALREPSRREYFRKIKFVSLARF